ncbi:MAG: hypothetical protein JWM10_4906 [Myxococcaceae bacterium]|nr:hypothetical protein [Myxococcaceae bacterium]
MALLRLTIAILAALALADCGNMHACTSDGVPCGEASTRPLSAQSSGGARPSSAPLFPTATVAANAPFVPPVFDEPAAAPSPAPPPDAPAPRGVATVTETTTAAAPEEEDTSRHHGRHGHRSRHGGGGHHSSSGGSHHRRHH